MSYGSGRERARIISVVVKNAWHKKHVVKGNVVWILNENDGVYGIECYCLLRRSEGNWDWETRDVTDYCTCPTNWLDLVSTDYEYTQEWKDRCRSHQKYISDRQKEANQKAKDVRVGSILKLRYRDLREGICVQVNPLQVQHEGSVYGIKKRAIREVINTQEIPDRCPTS